MSYRADDTECARSIARFGRLGLRNGRRTSLPQHLMQQRRACVKLILVSTLAFLGGTCVAYTTFVFIANYERETAPSVEYMSPYRQPGGARELVALPVKPDTSLSKCRRELRMREEVDWPADESNYGTRHTTDETGAVVPHSPSLIVLHETVISANTTKRVFQTPHPDDNQQASYHVMVDRDGNIVRFVPDKARAYGAGFSAWGDLRVKRRKVSRGSVNNIALHISLESPADGRPLDVGLSDETDTSPPEILFVDGHSGYTDHQYRATAQQVLLWQAAFGIPMSRVSTHEAVDRSHSRYDPRSFRWENFDRHHANAVHVCGVENYGAFASSWSLATASHTASTAEFPA